MKRITKVKESHFSYVYVKRPTNNHGVSTLLSTSNSMTFHDFFHDLFKFLKTIGLAFSFKDFKTSPCFRVFLTLSNLTDTKL